MKIKHYVAFYSLVTVSLLLPFWLLPVYAANISITGGTNGAACNSGGYFTPGSVTVNSGDTVTIAVPANDPYSGGLEIHGFSQGSFVVARGSSVTTSPISANVSYYGTWPSTGCMKGSGIITVRAPVVTQPPQNTTAPSASSSSTTTSTSSVPPVTKSATTTSPTSTTAVSPTTNAPAPTTSTKPAAKINESSIVSKTIPSSSSRNSAFKMVAAVGGSALAVALIVSVAIWRIIVRRRIQASLQQPPPSQLPPTQYPGGTTNIGN